VAVHDGVSRSAFLLDTPAQGLLLETRDWHVIHDFSWDAVLMVLASEPYDPADYLDEPYPE
jgi:hypothetical protein